VVINKRYIKTVWAPLPRCRWQNDGKHIFVSFSFPVANSWPLNYHIYGSSSNSIQYPTNFLYANSKSHFDFFIRQYYSGSFSFVKKIEMELKLHYLLMMSSHHLRVRCHWKTTSSNSAMILKWKHIKYSTYVNYMDILGRKAITLLDKFSK